MILKYYSDSGIKEFIEKFPELLLNKSWFSNRITKVQTDNQLRFQDLETSGLNNTNVLKKVNQIFP